MVLAILLLHIAAAAAAPLLGRRLGRAALAGLVLVPGATLAFSLAIASDVIGGHPWIEEHPLAPSLGFVLSFHIDSFSLLMALVVSGVGVLVYAYAYSYFSPSDAGIGKFAFALTLFTGAMTGLVASDNLLGLFLFWEATSIASYLLIGHKDTDEQARAGALQALLTTGLGGVAMLAGFVMLAAASETYSLRELVAAPPSGRLVEVALLLVLVGAFTKSAQAPFHAWLPSAMKAPTPVSAFLHSATMVKAGVFLIARLSPAFAEVGPWRPLCLTAGGVTMVLGAARALRQHDLKLLLAYGTVSQLGALVALFGIGVPEAAFAATVLLVAHACYKASLFMVAGVVERTTGNRDIRALGGIATTRTRGSRSGRGESEKPIPTDLRRAMPLSFAAAALGAASMAGLPPFLGFIAKEEVFSAFAEGLSGPGAFVLLSAAWVTSALTVAYAGRLVAGTFGGARPGEGGPRVVSAAFALPALILGALGLGAGVAPVTLESLVGSAAAVVSAEAQSSGRHLALWHGLGAPLWLSLTALLAGALLHKARGEVESISARLPEVPGSLETYRAALRGLLSGASRLTGFLQCGSLPVYLIVITLTLLLVPSFPLFTAFLRKEIWPWPEGAPASAVLAAAVIMALSLATIPARRRFHAVLLLGGAGYGVGVLFVIQGAPDLALTQFLVETLMLIIFVLVLRHLPPEFPSRRLRVYNLLRGAVSLLVAAFIFVFAYVASAPEVPRVSDGYFSRALSEAHGKNVVNLILVDFRALDTMGEITVLVAAAVAISALVSASRLRARLAEEQPEEA